MRLWTSQDVGFYEDLMSNGIAYCNKVSDFAKDNGIAYQWMVEQMKRRIGEPPLPEITLPVWAWYHYESKKKNKPPLSDNSKTHPGQKEMMIEFEAPAEDVLLSGFVLWHHPLNGWDLSIDKRMRHEGLAPVSREGRSVGEFWLMAYSGRSDRHSSWQQSPRHPPWCTACTAYNV